MQRKWYRSVLEKDIDAVNGAFLLFYLFLSFLVGVVLMTSSGTCVPLVAVHRSDWQEGRQDASDEHGDAA